MRINGEWYVCDDGMVRPVIRGEILDGMGAWRPVPFLVDTGADRSVLSAPILVSLSLQPIVTHDRLAGLGGIADVVVVETQVRLTHEEFGKIIFRGQYAAVTELEALDMSVLGRDITDLFAVIVDRTRDVVCLLGQRHQYTIERL